MWKRARLTRHRLRWRHLPLSWLRQRHLPSHRLRYYWHPHRHPHQRSARHTLAVKSQCLSLSRTRCSPPEPNGSACHQHPLEWAGLVQNSRAPPLRQRQMLVLHPPPCPPAPLPPPSWSACMRPPSPPTPRGPPRWPRPCLQLPRSPPRLPALRVYHADHGLRTAVNRTSSASRPSASLLARLPSMRVFTCTTACYGVVGVR